eukprot:CFRG0839T1
MMNFLFLACAVLALTASVFGGSPPAELGLRTLIVGSTDYSVIIAKSIVNAYGAPHDVYVASFPDFTENTWHSIVVCDSSVELSDLRTYANRTSARMVLLDTLQQTSDPEMFGVTQVTLADNIPNITIANTEEARQLAGVLNVTGNWNISEANPRAIVVSNPEMATGVIMYNDENNATNASSGANVFEEFTQANLAFGHAWFEWVTRGVFLGFRRLSLNIHVDDWYIQSALYDTGEDYRLNGTDVEVYVDWKTMLHDNTLPTGSDFKLEPAYNGGGIAMFGINDTGLLNATKEYAHHFSWISHTWTHMNMDWLAEDQCAEGYKMCHPNATVYDAEMQYNQMIARGEGINSTEYIWLYYGDQATPPHQFLDNRTELLENNYSPISMVTPEISGVWPADYNMSLNTQSSRKPYLNNSDFFDAIIRNGIHNLVGDNSRPELQDPYMYHAIVSTVLQYGQDGVIIVPRWSPNIPFNCNSYECVSQFYSDGGCNWVTYGPPCPGNMTGPDIVIRESKTATIPLLQLRWDPYMFHQANMHALPFREGYVPLVGIFVQDAVEDTMRYLTGLPFVSYRMDELSKMYRMRMGRDKCGINGVMSFDNEGNPTQVTVTGTGVCEAVVTLSNSSTISFIGNDTVVSYGPDTSVHQNLTAPAGVDATISILTPPGGTLMDAEDNGTSNFENSTAAEYTGVGMNPLILDITGTWKLQAAA